MKLAARFAHDAVGLLGAAVCVIEASGARRQLDLAAHRRLTELRPDHGWVGERQATGRVWFTCRFVDADGFETGGRSQGSPPADIDPATIPIVDAGPGYPLERRIEDTRGLLAAFEAGRSLQVGMTGQSEVGEGLGEARGFLLGKLDSIKSIVADGFSRELRDAWLAAVGTAELADTRAMIDRAQGECVVDSAVCGMARLLDAALDAAGPGSPAAKVIAGGFKMHVSAFRMDLPDDQLAILIMYLRKCGLPDLPRQMAEHFLSQARAFWHQGLAAPDLAGLIGAMFQAAHAADLSRRIYQDMVRIGGAGAPPAWRKACNVAEEWVVRASGSVGNAFANLDGIKWAQHRYSVGRALAVGGETRRDARANELIELHWMYPRAWKPMLTAPAPVETADEAVLGPAYAAEYFRLAGYAA